MTKFRLLIVGAVFLAPTVAFAALNTWSDLVNSLVSLMNYGVVTLVALAVAVYFYGISSNILKFGENDPEKKKAYFFWGIIILFVMVSVWGILRVVRYTLFG